MIKVLPRDQLVSCSQAAIKERIRKLEDIILSVTPYDNWSVGNLPPSELDAWKRRPSRRGLDAASDLRQTSSLG